MKKYVIYAGVNGAGKSTLYRTTHSQGTMKRVNTDEILKAFGDWRNLADLMKAGKIAVKLVKDYLETGESFNQETTLCGHSILKNIQKAKELGYIVEMHYVESFKNLKEAIKQCDLVALYDNSTDFRRFAIYKSGELVRLSKICPKWYDKLEWKEE